MRTIFMGTPDFAEVCLQKLIDNKYDIVGVFCQPDKPKGRKQVLTPPPVKVLAENNGIDVFQPTSLRNEEAINLVKSLQPEIIIVVAYGKLLPKEILDIPKYGCINVHGSLLPELRGAAPIQWAVINGNKITGVTIMKMDVGMDTGDIISTVETEIPINETAGELFDRLSVLGAQKLIDTIPEYINGNISPIKQEDEKATVAPMLSKENSNIIWDKPAAEIHNLVRGLNPWPTAITFLNDNRLKIHATSLTNEKTNKKPGEVVSADNKLIIACGDSYSLEILTLQRDGGKPMKSSDFLRGFPIKVGDIFNK